MDSKRQRERTDAEAPVPQLGTVVILGSHPTATAVAESLTESTDSVTLVTHDGDVDGVSDSLDVLHQPVRSASDLRSVGEALGTVDAVVTVGPDSEALLAGYLARQELDPPTVIATLDDPNRAGAFSATGLETIDVSAVLTERIRTRLEAARA